SPKSTDADGESRVPESREPLWRHMLGESLRERRTDSGETLNEVAARAGVSPQYLSEIERGLKEPSSEIIAAVGGALGITLLDLTLDVARSLAMTSDTQVEISVSQSFFALAA
ncbi:helix-turn-helix domain-containing protein, partial [Brevibacterium paucivorans]